MAFIDLSKLKKQGTAIKKTVGIGNPIAHNAAAPIAPCICTYSYSYS